MVKIQEGGRADGLSTIIQLAKVTNGVSVDPEGLKQTVLINQFRCTQMAAVISAGLV